MECVRLLPGFTPLAHGQRPQGEQYAAWVPRYLDQTLRQSKTASLTSEAYNHCANVLPGIVLEHKAKYWLGSAPTPIPSAISASGAWRRSAKTRPCSSNIAGPVIGLCGYLCINNQNIENKHDERFFFHGEDLRVEARVELTEEVRKAYEVLIRDYQDCHAATLRRRQHPAQEENGDPAISRFIIDRDAGNLRDGDLVYVLTDRKQQVLDIVPVSVPRITYKSSIAHRLPPDAAYALTCCDCPMRSARPAARSVGSRRMTGRGGSGPLPNASRLPAAWCSPMAKQPHHRGRSRRFPWRSSPRPSRRPCSSTLRRWTASRPDPASTTTLP